MSRPCRREQAKHLRNAHGLRDADYWLRMHVHSELALKRWELLYLIRESVAAPERLADESAEVQRRAAGRHEELVATVRLLERYLGEESAPDRWTGRLRVISRHRLQQLRYELAQVANAYAAGLRASCIDVPAYVHVEDLGPLFDFAEWQRIVRSEAAPALERGARSAMSKFSEMREASRRTVERLRAPDEDDGDDAP